MKTLQRVQRFRDWFPVPTDDGRVRLRSWILLEGNRLAVAGALLAFVYVSLMLIGTIWPFEMRQLLTETSTVENILETFLGGIILLVSIVVSINSIVLTQDITSIEEQEQRIRGVGEFWRDVDELTETDESPTDLRSFLQVLTRVIREEAQQVADTTDELGADFEDDAREYTESVTGMVDRIDEIEGASSGDFSLLWTALEVDYGRQLDQTEVLRSRSEDSQPEPFKTSLDRLVEAFQLFAVGREYFKTMYYTSDVSRLSRVLLTVALPAILITASSILAINAQMFPTYWIFGLPPLHSFVATVFTIALVPYIVLTSFMLRLSTVAKRTSSRGLFIIQ